MDTSATDQQVDDDVEQSEQDQAVEAEPGVSEGEEQEAGSAPAESESDEVELLSRDQVESLRRDPDKLIKELNRAATKKFQTVAKERAELEPYVDFIRSLDENPREAVAALAAQLGMRLEGATPEQRQGMVQELGDVISDDVRQSLGPEYEDLAERLAPAIRKVAERVAAETARPLVEEQNRLLRESAERESAAAIQVFEKAHPDFRKHEKAMVELSQRLKPAQGMGEQDYLRALYTVVTASSSEGDTAKRLIKRINSSTKSDSGGNRVPSREVNVEPSALPSFEDAAAAARRGERWEH
jgi:hypothetical protein